MAHVEVSAETLAELRAMLDSGDEEPLAHQLLREAWSERRSNPTSSLLIGMAALEIGVKRFIAACLPEAKWLAENVPTPPVVRLLTEYLPQLSPTPGGHHFVMPDSDEVVAALKKAVTKRNELAHKGSEIRPDQLTRTLRAIRNVLWSLDDAQGHDWAAGYRTTLDSDPPVGFRRL